MTLTQLKTAIEIVGFVFETSGVVVIAIGTGFACIRFLTQRASHLNARYRHLRQELGGSIVLGLEFLVAGDIIRTVAVDPSLQSVAVLGLIVLIRTFLSMALQLEIDGCWPWQRRTRASQAPE